ASAPVFGNGCLEYVVDGDDAQQAVLSVHDRDRVEIEVGHQQRDVGQIGGGVDPQRTAIHQCLNDFPGIGLQQRYARHHSREALLVIEHVNLDERLWLDGAGGGDQG